MHSNITEFLFAFVLHARTAECHSRRLGVAVISMPTGVKPNKLTRLNLICHKSCFSLERCTSPPRAVRRRPGRHLPRKFLAQNTAPRLISLGAPSSPVLQSMPRRAAASLDQRRQSIHVALPIVPSTRLDRLFDLGGGVLLHPWLRRQDEGRALAALEPMAAPLSVLVRRWAWPMPRRWGSHHGAGPGQFNEPWDVSTTSGGDIVVCDLINSCVLVFRADGTFVRQWGSRGAVLGQFNEPRSVAVSSADEVFVADTWNHRVQVFRLDGSFVRSWGSQGDAPGQFQYPSGVAVHGDLVLVSDQSNHRIQCFGLDGTFVRMWGSRGEAPGQLNCPFGLAVSSSGEVLVCDHLNQRVQVFDLNGTFQRAWGSQGGAPGQFQGPLDVDVSSTGEVLVSDATRVQVFASDGSFVRRLHLPAGAHAFAPWGVAVTLSGDVVVCDYRNHVILVEPVGA